MWSTSFFIILENSDATGLTVHSDGEGEVLRSVQTDAAAGRGFVGCKGESVGVFFFIVGVQHSKLHPDHSRG